MRSTLIRKILPGWKNALLALLSAVLLVAAFPDLELWWTAWFALVPLMFAVEREKASFIRSFLTGWLFGTAFFFGTCWWLAYAPIHYAAFPPLLAYSLVLVATAGAGLFPAVFAGVLALLLRRFGSWAYLAAPVVWVFTELLRYWVTGNNWNAIGYSQAFTMGVKSTARVGGVELVGFFLFAFNAILCFVIIRRQLKYSILLLSVCAMFAAVAFVSNPDKDSDYSYEGKVVAIQPNVPMSGLDYQKWNTLRQRQIDMAEVELQKLPINRQQPSLVILPESPMNFMYEDDREFQKFINDFARRNNVSVLFNSAEPDRSNGKFFNSAVMIDPEGRKVAQYDKIYLLPFGEAVPVPFESFVPAFVGSFSYGKEYDLLPLGDAKGGVMICFESHFGQLSREYVQNGADVIIEMTNDGYLGPTPVLRQHLANAVFRAVETNRPVLRVTNVGVTAYINERGQVLDPLPSYSEGTRVWSVAKSDGKQTFYVRYGDWFGWLCSAVTLALIIVSFRKRRSAETN